MHILFCFLQGYVHTPDQNTLVNNIHSCKDSFKQNHSTFGKTGLLTPVKKNLADRVLKSFVISILFWVLHQFGICGVWAGQKCVKNHEIEHLRIVLQLGGCWLQLNCMPMSGETAIHFTAFQRLFDRSLLVIALH